MKRWIFVLLTAVLFISGCAVEKSEQETPPLPDQQVSEDEVERQPQEDGCNLQETDLFRGADGYYFNTEDGIHGMDYDGTLRCIDKEGSLIGFYQGVPFVKKENTLYMGFGTEQKKLFELSPPTEMYASFNGMAGQGDLLLLYGEWRDGNGQGEGGFYVTVTPSARTTQQFTLEKPILGAVFGEKRFYYAQGGAVWQTDLAGKETRKLCDTEANLQKMWAVGDDLVVTDEVNALVVCRGAGTVSLTEQIAMPSAVTVSDGVIYGNRKGGGYYGYDIETGKETEVSQEGLVFAQDGLLQTVYDYGEGVRRLTATVGGQQRTATVPIKRNVVNALYDEKGVGVRLQNGTVYTALWN